LYITGEDKNYLYGKLGIGTASPASYALLHLKGGTGVGTNDGSLVLEHSNGLGQYRLCVGDGSQFYIHDDYDHFIDMPVEGGKQFVFDVKYRINHLWNIGGYVRWDSSRGGMEEWQVSAQRDLHDFILDFGCNFRDSLIDGNSTQVFFNFHMKAFPMLALRAGGSRASFGAPRIGETVAGSNVGSVDFSEFYQPQTPSFLTS